MSTVSLVDPGSFEYCCTTWDLDRRLFGTARVLPKSQFNEQLMVVILREDGTSPIVEVANKCGLVDQTI